MSLDTQTILKRRRYQELMQAGQKAYAQGNRRLAHDYWREAATVDPYMEEVWLALYRVLDNDDDRIVCLENIIAIDPMNVQARRRLRDYQERAGASAPPQQVVRRSNAPAQARTQQRKPAKTAPGVARNGSKRTTQKRRRAKADSGARTRRVVIVVLLLVLGVLLVLVASGVLNVG